MKDIMRDELGAPQNSRSEHFQAELDVERRHTQVAAARRRLPRQTPSSTSLALFRPLFE
jgi:predicted dithiol-disulfide oxidoreductase (DUF899 family)